MAFNSKDFICLIYLPYEIGTLTACIHPQELKNCPAIPPAAGG